MKLFWLITFLVQVAAIFGYYWLHRDAGGEAYDVLETFIEIILTFAAFDIVAGIVCAVLHFLK